MKKAISITGALILASLVNGEPASMQAIPVFQEAGGIVAIEAESMPKGASWVSSSAQPGYTGSGYYVWTGVEYNDNNKPPSPYPANEIITYRFNIKTEGKYNFRCHGYNSAVNGSTWAGFFIRLDGDATKWTVPRSLNSSGWAHVFQENIAHRWSWSTAIENWPLPDPNGVQPYVTLAAGVHTLEVGGYAQGIGLNRFHFYMDNVANPLSTNLPQSVSMTLATIVTHPQNQTVNQGQTATFSIVVSGDGPFSYQWKKQGVTITGATSASYTTPATTLLDSGKYFSCTVTNGAGFVLSRAMLSVNSLSSVVSAMGQPSDQLGVNVNAATPKGIDFIISLPWPGDYSLNIYDLSGKKLWTMQKTVYSPGTYPVHWDLNSNARLGNGLYVARFESEKKQIRKVFSVIQ